MKYKNKVKRLQTGISAFDNLSQKEKAERKRPGSVKWR